MKEIVTTGLNKAEVLLTLYNHATLMDISGFKAYGFLDKAMNESNYQNFFERINLGSGFRVINVNLENPEFFDATGYDNVHGEGQAAKAIAVIQNQVRETLPSEIKKRKIQG